jgi:hypothetical protein
MEHVPAWSQVSPKGINGDPDRPGYYAPQYRSDKEWYDNTLFSGETGHPGPRGFCFTSNPSWPLGHWLDKPYRKA